MTDHKKAIEFLRKNAYTASAELLEKTEKVFAMLELANKTVIEMAAEIKRLRTQQPIKMKPDKP